MSKLDGHVLVQGFSVGQIAIVSDTNSIWIVGIERLRFRVRFRAGTTSRGGITDMAHSHVATKFQHVMLLKDISHQAIVFAQVQSAAF